VPGVTRSNPGAGSRSSAPGLQTRRPSRSARANGAWVCPTKRTSRPRVKQPGQLAVGRVGRDPAGVVPGPCVGREDPKAADPCVPAGRQRAEERPRRLAQVPARRIDAAGQHPAIVVAADRRDAALAQEREGLVGEQPVVEQVAAADDPIDAEPVDLYERVAQRVDVRVHVAEDRQPRHVCGLEHSHAIAGRRSAGSRWRVNGFYAPPRGALTMAARSACRRPVAALSRRARRAARHPAPSRPGTRPRR